MSKSFIFKPLTVLACISFLLIVSCGRRPEGKTDDIESIKGAKLRCLNQSLPEYLTIGGISFNSAVINDYKGYAMIFRFESMDGLSEQEVMDFQVHVENHYGIEMFGFIGWDGSSKDTPSQIYDWIVDYMDDRYVVRCSRGNVIFEIEAVGRNDIYELTFYMYNLSLLERDMLHDEALEELLLIEQQKLEEERKNKNANDF